MTRPPRLASWIAERSVRAETWRHDVLGDLAEEFAGVADANGAASANRWYWRQVLTLAAASALARARAFFVALGVLFFIGDRPMTSLAQEIRLAARTLRRRPGVTAAIVLTLAIGLGMNAAIFGMIDSLLVNPFAFKDVNRLVAFAELSDDNPYPQESLAPGTYFDLRDKTTSFDRMAAFVWSEINMSGGNEPERVAGFSVSGSFFDTLGITPQLGRLINDSDQVWGQHHQVVISDGLWRSRFGADPAVIGRSISLDGTPTIVVGVAPPGFVFPEGASLWTPMAMSPEDAADRKRQYITAFAHLKPGVSRATGAADAATVYAQLKTAYPDAMRTRHFETMTFTKEMVDTGLPTIFALWQAAAVLVLLIGGTNVMNLLLARSEERQRELSVRLAIGASRVRIVRQLVVESVVLSAFAIPGALLVAAAGLAAVKTMLPATLIRFVPGWEQLHVSWPLALWTSLFAAIAGALFGLLPAWQSSRPNLVDALKDGGRSQSAGAGRGRVRRGLVIAEIAIALPLLVASGLAAIGVERFATGNQGYDPQGLLRASVVLPDPAYKEDAAMRQFSERWMDELMRQPGVTSAGASSILPASGSDRNREIEVEGRPVDPDRPTSVNFRQVTPGLLPTLRIPILEGRGIDPSDRADAQPIGVVSRSMADKFWPGQSPIGKRLKVPETSKEWITVVGVCGDVIHNWFSSRNSPTLYVPVAQAPTHYVNVVVRAAGSPAAVTETVKRSLAAIDKTLPLFSAWTMQHQIEERSAGLRLIGNLMTVFGVVALVLAAIGIYSVMSFYVTLRRHDIGIRLALGATPSDVLRLTLTQASWLTGLGIGIGLALAIALARLMEQALFGVVSPDPSLLAAVAGALTVVAFVSSLVPALAATKVDPAATLRD